jgi:hypothetical protein
MTSDIKSDNNEMCVCGHPRWEHAIVFPKNGCTHEDGKRYCICVSFSPMVKKQDLTK